MGSEEEHKHDDKNDARALYRLVLVKCRERFAAHRCRINVERWSVR